jgi:DNA polymerase-3 subunit delta
MLDLDRFSDITQMYSMFAPCNCILVSNLNADNLSADELEKLLGILERVPDVTAVIFNITCFSVKDERGSITAKNRKLIDFIRKNGTVTEVKPKTKSELIKLIVRRVQSLGSAIQPGCAGMIAEYCGYDGHLIDNEVDRLCAYANGQEITVQTVDMLVPKQLELKVFMLSNAILTSRTKDALNILDELIRQNQEPIALLAVISSAFIDVYRAKAAIESGRGTQDVIDDFGYKGKEFVIKNAFASCSRLSAEKLYRCMELLKETDLALKSSSGDGKILLEKAVVGMSADG